MKMMIKGLLAATMLTAAAGGLTGVAQAAVVVKTFATGSGIAVPNNIDGVYLNVITGVTGASAAAVTGWDVNIYNNGGGLTFYGTATPYGILATGTAGTTAVARSLTVGTSVSSTSTGFYNQFQTVGTAFQAATGTQYLGFRFLNETTGVTNYGYLQLATTAGTGFPATITGYAYENTGLGLTVASIAPTASAVPEPATWGMMILGFGMIGAAARSRKVKTTVKFA
jgi:hypothetical protein